MTLPPSHLPTVKFNLGYKLLRLKRYLRYFTIMLAPKLKKHYKSWSQIQLWLNFHINLQFDVEIRWHTDFKSTDLSPIGVYVKRVQLMDFSLHHGDTAKCYSKWCFPAVSCTVHQMFRGKMGLRQHLCRNCLSKDVISFWLRVTKHNYQKTFLSNRLIVCSI